MCAVQTRDDLENTYSDVYTPEVMDALAALAPFNADQKAVMAARIERRAQRARDRQLITFLDADSRIPRTDIAVHDASNGKFTG